MLMLRHRIPPCKAVMKGFQESGFKCRADHGLTSESVLHTELTMRPRQTA
jgi:hypothetical protein